MSSRPTPAGIAIVAAILWLLAPLVRMNYFEPIERLADEADAGRHQSRVSVTWLLRGTVVVLAVLFALYSLKP